MTHFDREQYSEATPVSVPMTQREDPPLVFSADISARTPGLPDSYARQWYRLSLPGVELAVRPRDSLWRAADAWGEPIDIGVDPWWLPELTGCVVGYWHPDGNPSHTADRGVSGLMASAMLEATGMTALAVGTLEAHNRWVEPAFLLRGCEPAQARDVARQWGQPLWVSLSGQSISVWESATGGAVETLPAEWYLLSGRPCPMSLGLEYELPPKPVGGPWVSRSIEVFGMWSFHYDLVHRLLPCDACGEVVVDSAREANRLIPDFAPSSRYGPVHRKSECRVNP